MHKSRIDGIFLDYPGRSIQASVAFWAAATGRDAAQPSSPNDPYHSLGRFDGQMVVELQEVGDDTAPRVHLDIATDNVDAEVARLEKLGATRLRSYDDGGYWQMVDPGGLVFCVLPPHTPDFDERATEWP